MYILYAERHIMSKPQYINALWNRTLQTTTFQLNWSCTGGEAFLQNRQRTRSTVQELADCIPRTITHSLAWPDPIPHQGKGSATWP